MAAEPNVIVLTHRLASIDGFFVDCLISDNHTFDAEVTDFPVESGSTVSDNIRNKPLVVVMDCLVSNTPLGQLVSLRGSDAEPADSAYELLLAIRAQRRPVTIFTSLRTYTSMALQNLTIPRESGRGDELRFTATFKQIELVVNKRDKNVAIVGAKSGGTNTSAPGIVEMGGTKYVYLYTADSTWFDFNINAWRKLAKRVPFVKGGPASLPIKPGPTTAGPGQYILSRGRPIQFTQTQWDHRTPAQRLDSAVSQDLDKITGPREFNQKGKQMRFIVLLAPSQYVFERGDPATPGGSTSIADGGPDSVGRD